MTISLRVSEIDGILIKMCAKHHGLSTSEFIRTVVQEAIEKEYNTLLDDIEENGLKKDGLKV